MQMKSLFGFDRRVTGRHTGSPGGELLLQLLNGFERFLIGFKDRDHLVSNIEDLYGRALVVDLLDDEFHAYSLSESGEDALDMAKDIIDGYLSGYLQAGYLLFAFGVELELVGEFLIAIGLGLCGLGVVTADNIFEDVRPRVS